MLNGNLLYGTTLNGGSSNWGSVFSISTNGTGYKTLKSFSAPTTNSSGTLTNYDGAEPLAGLITDGRSLYGTTYQGGSNGLGTLFTLRLEGTNFAVLNNFAGTNGAHSYAGLCLSSNILYGTTAVGGVSSVSNKGTVFRINPDGTGFALLQSFSTTNGLLPLEDVTLSGGTLYGTTYEGGTSNWGTIFSINTAGTGFTTLKYFTNGDGMNPRSSLLLLGDTLYGTTEGDNYPSNSIIFKLNTNGTGYTILKRFSTVDPISGSNSDGAFVRAGFALWNGVLYGTTSQGGYFGNGDVFKINPDGSGFAVLKYFPATIYQNSGYYTNTDGAGPITELIVADGTLYGATQYGGTHGFGTLFSLAIPPPPMLQVTCNGQQLLLYWSDDGLNRTLQTAPDLTSGNWTSISALNWTNAATNPQQIGCQMAVSSMQAAAFFRLR